MTIAAAVTHLVAIGYYMSVSKLVYKSRAILECSSARVSVCTHYCTNVVATEAIHTCS